MSTAAPGWYPDPDPSRIGGWRWWDGWQWGPSAPLSAGGLSAQDLDGETSVAKWARLALIGQACGQLLSMVMFPLVAHNMRTLFHQIQENARAGSNDVPVIRTPRALLATQPLSLIGLASMVVLIAWMYRSSSNAQRMGLRLRRSPTLAAASFIIPIVNFWWPAQAAADLLPPDSPDRRRAVWWWASYITTIPLSLTVAALSLVSPAAALVPAAVAFGLLVVMVTQGRAVIDAAGRAHAAAVAG